MSPDDLAEGGTTGNTLPLSGLPCAPACMHTAVVLCRTCTGRGTSASCTAPEASRHVTCE
eukprot:6819105-Prorocentrum_lima.AAC.1